MNKALENHYEMRFPDKPEGDDFMELAFELLELDTCIVGLVSSNRLHNEEGLILRLENIKRSISTLKDLSITDLPKKEEYYTYIDSLLSLIKIKNNNK